LLSAFRKRGAVPRSRGNQLLDFGAGEKRDAAEHFGHEGDPGEVLDRFHIVEGGEQVGAASHRAVIGHENGVVVGHERFQGDS
jgi:hypothetical protein